jgi:DNA-binding IclR family transcriptional regulator
MTLSSVDHALVLLEHLQDRFDLRVADAAALLDVAPSSAHRLLATLHARGFVAQDEVTRRYSLGPKMLGSIGPGDIPDAARRVVARLGELTGSTVHLGVLSGGDVRFIHSWTPMSTARVSSKVGSPMPAHLVSSGKVLLAEHSASSLARQFPPQRLGGPTPRSIATTENLLSELETVRVRGYGRNVEESEAGVNAVAIAVQFRTRPSRIALSISDSPDRLALTDTQASSLRETLALMRRAATSLTSSFADRRPVPIG